MNLNLSPTFIEIYDKALSSKECNILISQFENHPSKTEGKVQLVGMLKILLKLMTLHFLILQ